MLNDRVKNICPKRRPSVNIDAQEHWKHSSSTFSTISFIFVNETNIIINFTSWILNIWSLVPKRIQIKLVRVASSAHSFNLMRFAALVIIFSISTPLNSAKNFGALRDKKIDILILVLSEKIFSERNKKP
jgi:hypothetical protein